MRRAPIFVLCLAGLLVLGACGGKNAQKNAAKTSEESKTAKEQVTPTAKRPAPKGATKANEAKNWGLSFDGIDLPSVEGSTVQAMQLPGQMIYTFMGPEQVSNLDIHDLKEGQTGTFPAFTLKIAYAAEKYVCMASKTDQSTDVTVHIEPKDDGIRATLDGKVRCSPVRIAGSTGKSEQTFATVHAWFEK